MRALHCRALEALGYRAIAASTGAQALEAASRADLVLTDLNLPDMWGEDLARALREAGITAPILGVTGESAEARDPLDHVEQKPMRVARLRQLLAEFLPA